ncbi:MAG TPA: serine hydrolase [Luteibaculaceae bacterium]|nr:serine hydrolase [Luteibaculaceae bacterium]
MRKIIKVLGVFAAVVLVIVGLLQLTGNGHVITAVRMTYLSGQKGPGIYDLSKFNANRIANAGRKEWLIDTGSFRLNSEELSYLEKMGTTGMLIAEGDTIVMKQFWEGHTDSTLSNSFSMAKSVVAMLVYIAQSEGLIPSIDDKVSRYLPEFATDGRDSITLRHLISMSSGLAWSESGGNPLSDNAKAYYGTDLSELVLHMPYESTPGVAFDYKSGNTALLALCLRRATGVTLAEYAAEKLWRPMAASYPAYWSTDEKGVEKSYCCIYGTLSDFAKIGRLLLDSGKVGNQVILPANYFADAFQPAPLQTVDGKLNTRYSSASLWLVTYKGKVYPYLRGILGQYVLLLPEKNAVVVRVGHKRDEVDEEGHPKDIYRYIAIALRATEK